MKYSGEFQGLLIMEYLFVDQSTIVLKKILWEIGG